MSAQTELLGEEFVMGYRQQNVWTQWIALAFFFGKIGAGLFIVSLFMGTPLIALIGLIIENCCKGGALLIHLGRPERFLRALSRPRTSWIARTVWAMGIFTLIALIYLWLPAGSTAWVIFKTLALIGAVIVAITDGFVVNDSTGIPLWSTPILPFLFLLYSLLGGTTLFLFMQAIGWITLTNISHLETIETALIILC